jgi:putative membrane protein
MIFIPEINTFIAGLPNFLIQVGVALTIFAVGLVIYVLLTPHKELALIRNENPSASLAFGGVIVGLAIPLGAALANSSSIVELAIWGTITVLIQLITFRIVDVLLNQLPRRIADGDVAAAIFLMAVKLGVGIVLAGALSDPNVPLYSALNPPFG